jgi:hypothetical protein
LTEGRRDQRRQQQGGEEGKSGFHGLSVIGAQGVLPALGQPGERTRCVGRVTGDARLAIGIHPVGAAHLGEAARGLATERSWKGCTVANGKRRGQSRFPRLIESDAGA